MSEIQILINKIQLLEFHQKLLLELIRNPKLEFYRLIVESGLSRQEMEHFLSICDHLNEKFAEQKAEGFVHFHPLFAELKAALPVRLNLNEVVHACLTQNLYGPLFQEFAKYL
ncbi:DUF1878 family protein [Bacillus rubiinfantis]|uniref:DUF1878 family protein n=1 Tax=Bacillus rubiinfantis TaxID=1499680 RepID=UPI0006933246|nr:DUF1878 family protein [Bacillus rubiinfantis]